MRQIPGETMTPHQRIMRAARSGDGLTLTAADVDALSRDDAIATASRRDDEACPECGKTCERSRSSRGNYCCLCADLIFGPAPNQPPCSECAP